MNVLNKPLNIALLILASMCCAFFLHLQTLQERNRHLKDTYAQARAASDQRQLVIEQLQQHITRLNEQQRQSTEAQAELERLAQNRLTTLRKLEDENDQLRQWAAHRLPAEFGRLRDRDALSGANAYRQRLRDTQTLHTTGSSFKNQQ